MIQPNLSNASIQCNIVPVNKKPNNRKSEEKDMESIASSVSDNIARAITISESDVEIFRSYIVKDKKNIFNVDLFSYDANDDYKRSIFYKITPIVKVQRHPVILKLVKRKQLKIKLNSAELRNKTKLNTLSKKGVHCDPKIKIIEYIKDSSEDETVSNILDPEKEVKEKNTDNVVHKDLIENVHGGKRKAAMEVKNKPKRIRLNNSDLKENINNVQKDQYGKPINKVYLVKKWTVKNKRWDMQYNGNLTVLKNYT